MVIEYADGLSLPFDSLANFLGVFLAALAVARCGPNKL